MLEPNTARANNSTPDRPQGTENPAESQVTIETRFGSLTFGPEHGIFMPVGPLGFTDFRQFGLAELPPPASDRFKLLQSLDNHELSFIVTPLAIEHGKVAPEDLTDAAASVGIPMDVADFVLIVTIRIKDQVPFITANLRAPVIIETNRRIARQVVMANSAYPIQLPL